MNHREIRKRWFEFFKKHGHDVVPSSSLIPAQDPTLLFANAGMNQFKDVFLGQETRSYTRATTIQKCVRAGGKHNDLDNVGFTKRHLTFFEMMGNFSFGDFFKKEAIPFAWELLTKGYGLSQDKLYPTVYKNDQESYDIWHNNIGIPKERIFKLGAADNFWQMGDTGPCGPCTEILLDRGPELGCGRKDCQPGCSCDRYLELWNLVFMQYNRQPDGTDIPLKKTGVDTGMGIERIASVLQNTDSVFGTDLFSPLIAATEQLTGINYSKQTGDMKAAFQVIADHTRSASLLIADGCAPSNDGRGYVLRKIIRRAALFAQKLTDKNIFPQVATAFINEMKDIYPELAVNETLIEKTLTSEIERFAANLQRGKAILEQYFKENRKSKIISGQQAFKLYDTFGFPIELVMLVGQEQGFSVDTDEFEAEMEKQRAQSGNKVETVEIELQDGIETIFTGYEHVQTDTEISALIADNKQVKTVKQGTECWVITKESPLYPARGGQVSDHGWIEIEGKRADVLDLQWINKAIATRIIAPVDLNVGEKVVKLVDIDKRDDTRKNHTATHLLQAALIERFGKQIKQSGSVVHPDYLRFDFTYHSNLSTEDSVTIERMVNQKVMENIPIDTTLSNYRDAIKKGVIAFFGDKFNHEQVRVVEVGDFSAELCGGTHVHRTGDIGAFKIVEMSALSAGHRRITALTGPKAVALFQHNFKTVKNLSQEFKVTPEEVEAAVQKQKEHLRKITLQLRDAKKQLTRAQIPQLLEQVSPVNGIPVLYHAFKNTSVDELKDIAHQLTTKQPGLYFLTAHDSDKSIFFCQVSSEFQKQVETKKLGAWLKDEHGLQGGGKPGTLQGGGGHISSSFKEGLTQWIKKNS